MFDAQARLEELLEKLKARDSRITPQRVTILRTLIESKEHPSAEHIYEKIKASYPMISLATVYKTLLLLKEMGEVLELSFPNGHSRYDARLPHPHIHLICLECHRIIDSDVRYESDITAELEQTTGFRIKGQRIDFYGICPDCQRLEGQKGGDYSERNAD
jgi:Fur family peroxide stress response transcriptional regulator